MAWISPRTSETTGPENRGELFGANTAREGKSINFGNPGLSAGSRIDPGYREIAAYRDPPLPTPTITLKV